MKWGVVGIIEAPWEDVEALPLGAVSAAGNVWGVRLFDNREDARQFAAGLQGVYNKIGLDDDGDFIDPAHSAIDELRDTDPTAYDRLFRQSVHVGWELRYQLMPFSEEFEAPHKENTSVEIAPHRLHEGETGDEDPDGIVHLDMQNALFLAAREDDNEWPEVGGYIAVARGANEGWYLSVTIDDEHATHDLTIDAGPFDEPVVALREGADEVLEWGYNNDLEMDRPSDRELEDWLNHRFDNWRD